MRISGTRGPSPGECGCGKFPPRLGAKIWSGHPKRGGVSILPPYGSLNGRAGYPGMTETHKCGIDIRNHSHEAPASDVDSDEGVKIKRTGSSGDEVAR